MERVVLWHRMAAPVPVAKPCVSVRLSKTRFEWSASKILYLKPPSMLMVPLSGPKFWPSMWHVVLESTGRLLVKKIVRGEPEGREKSMLPSAPDATMCDIASRNDTTPSVSSTTSRCVVTVIELMLSGGVYSTGNNNSFQPSPACPTSGRSIKRNWRTTRFMSFHCNGGGINRSCSRFPQYRNLKNQ